MWKFEGLFAKIMKNVKMWKLEDLLAKFNKKCEKLETVDIFAKHWKNEVYLKKLVKTQKNEKFEDLFALVMKICRKIIKVKAWWAKSTWEVLNCKNEEKQRKWDKMRSSLNEGYFGNFIEPLFWKLMWVIMHDRLLF